jgi:hypothetical protein
MTIRVSQRSPSGKGCRVLEYLTTDHEGQNPDADAGEVTPSLFTRFVGFSERDFLKCRLWNLLRDILASLYMDMA